MTIDYSQQHLNAYQTDNFENEDAAGDSKRRLKTKLLADKTCRLLYGDSTNLIDDIFNHPLSIDYFNVYLSLPVSSPRLSDFVDKLSIQIFGQRVLYQRITDQWDFDPPLLSKDQNYDETKEWLTHCRLNNYIHTDIYIESLLALLLTQTDDALESSSKSYTFLGSKEATVEEQSYIFSTVTDVRQFHQFLQTTSGIKYWNFFIDSMRLLRSRRSTQSNRIDISYLNFIDKYYSRKDELHSITVDLDNPSMPNSRTSDTIWFQMAINAMHQLRIYWLPRYLSQVSSSSSRMKIKHRKIDPNPNRIESTVKSWSSSENMIETSFNDLPKTESTNNEVNLVKHTLGNISYIDYNPQQYILIQPSEQDDSQQDTEEFNESDNTHRTEKDCKIEFQDTSPSFSDRSIEDYASDANLELFYRILVSDSLAGSPFIEHISQTIPKTDTISYQTCLRFITDAEILLSISSGKFKERILRQFLSRYLQVTATEQLPSSIADTIEEQRIDLITELMTKDNNQYPLLWKLLLKITKFLIPHFLNYIKFDRLRFLVQIKGKTLHPNVIFEDLRRLLPSINFKTFATNQPDKTERNLKQVYFNETEFISKSTLINCGEQQNDLLNSSIKNQYNTTEKLINTDEQCQFRLGERFPPLTDIELEEELHRLCTKFKWKDTKIILGKSFNVSTTSHLPNHTVHPLSHTTIEQPLIIDKDFKLNSIETFTVDVMNSAREIVEIDRFVTNLMDESLNIFQRKSSFDSTKIDLNSSPLSPVFEEILLTDSSSSTTRTSPKLIINNTNNNALESDTNQIISIERKFLSLIGSYFINSPSQTKTNDHLLSKSILLSDSTKKLTNNSTDNYLNNFTSSTINTNKTNFFHESIRFAPKDASNEVRNLLINKPIFHFQNDDNQKELLEFIQNQITNSQWPLEEYIGHKGQRAWRALKLAADISELDDEFMLNYHHDFDWISSNDNFGSFNERNYVILRDFNRRIEQQKRHQIINWN